MLRALTFAVALFFVAPTAWAGSVKPPLDRDARAIPGGDVVLANSSGRVPPPRVVTPQRPRPQATQTQRPRPTTNVRPRQPTVKPKSPLSSRGAFKSAVGSSKAVGAGRNKYFIPKGKKGVDVTHGAKRIDRTALIKSKATFAANKPRGLSKTQNIQSHYANHKAEFPKARNATQYAKLARNFRNNPPRGTLQRNLSKGRTAYFHKKSNQLMIMNSKGKVTTFFKPAPKSTSNPRGYGRQYKSSMDYFLKGLK